MTRPKEELNPAAIYRPLGLFLILFGAVVLVSAIFTETRPGVLANLVAGLLIAGIGAGMFRSGRNS